MDTKKIMADFQFLNNKVIKFSMENNLLDTKKKPIKVDFDIDYEVIRCDEVDEGYYGTIHFIVNLTGNIEESEMFKIHLKMGGNFIGSKNSLDIDKFGEMLEVNGTATLSQITRAYLTSVTSLSGIPPIILPMVNIYAMKKYKESNK